MPGRMEGKKALVVGAGQPEHEALGNGRAISRRLAQEGAVVVALDREADRAEATVKAIEAEGGTAHPLVGDVLDPDDCARVVRDAAEIMGGLDTLVNVVGGSYGDKGMLELEPDAWQHVMDLNLRSTWLVSRAAVPFMEQRGGGAITNISSVGSRAQGGTFFSYSIAKSGVNALTHFMAVELAPSGIRCNVILPSFILTPHSFEGLIRGGIAEDEAGVKELAKKSVPLGRPGSAWDVAHAVLFLSSEESSFITGLEVPVDGGALQIVGRYQARQ
jgi:NAD(P)-dependent dehydrogenase (short-subunit alcohol dehydrogenase family)